MHGTKHGPDAFRGRCLEGDFVVGIFLPAHLPITWGMGIAVLSHRVQRRFAPCGSKYAPVMSVSESLQSVSAGHWRTSARLCGKGLLGHKCFPLFSSYHLSVLFQSLKEKSTCCIQEMPPWVLTDVECTEPHPSAAQHTCRSHCLK